MNTCMRDMVVRKITDDKHTEITLFIDADDFAIEELMEISAALRTYAVQEKFKRQALLDDLNGHNNLNVNISNE